MSVLRPKPKRRSCGLVNESGWSRRPCFPKENRKARWKTRPLRQANFLAVDSIMQESSSKV